MDTRIPTDQPATADVNMGQAAVTHRQPRSARKATQRELLKENRALRKTVDFLSLALCGLSFCAVRGRDQEYYAYVAHHLPEGSGIRETVRRQLILRNCLPGDPGEKFSYRQYLDSSKRVERFVDAAEKWCDTNSDVT